MSVDSAGGGSNDGPSVLCGRVCHANVRSESCAATDRLARQAQSRVDREMGIEDPVVLDELPDLSRSPILQTSSLKGNLLGYRVILPEHLDGSRNVGPHKRPP